jgi:hypothetical protein
LIEPSDIGKTKGRLRAPFSFFVSPAATQMTVPSEAKTNPQENPEWAD